MPQRSLVILVTSIVQLPSSHVEGERVKWVNEQAIKIVFNLPTQDFFIKDGDYLA